MRQILLFLIIISVSSVFAQEKVTWQTSYDAENQQLVFKSKIAEGWHLYSQFIKNDIGPVPTTFDYTTLQGVELVGKTEEPKAILEYDPNFEAELSYFKGEAVFQQKIKQKSKGLVSGVVTYMVCNDVMCLPPVDYKFSITIQ